jgi:hypothetical protein
LQLGVLCCYCGNATCVVCCYCGNATCVVCCYCGNATCVVCCYCGNATCVVCCGCGTATCVVCCYCGNATCVVCCGCGTATCVVCCGCGNATCVVCCGCGTATCVVCCGCGTATCVVCCGCGSPCLFKLVWSAQCACRSLGACLASCHLQCISRAFRLCLKQQMSHNTALVEAANVTQPPSKRTSIRWCGLRIVAARLGGHLRMLGGRLCMHTPRIAIRVSAELCGWSYDS